MLTSNLSTFLIVFPSVRDLECDHFALFRGFSDFWRFTNLIRASGNVARRFVSSFSFTFHATFCVNWFALCQGNSSTPGNRSWFSSFAIFFSRINVAISTHEQSRTVVTFRLQARPLASYFPPSSFYFVSSTTTGIHFTRRCSSLLISFRARNRLLQRYLPSHSFNSNSSSKWNSNLNVELELKSRKFKFQCRSSRSLELECKFEPWVPI